MALTTLFLDLNAYFASVEQQVDPSLRGRPVGVAPITSDSGCCIATSYEARGFGVKTGTRVGEARALCPEIRIVDARPRLYVHMHHRILEAVDRHIPIHRVHSIDEFSCRLDATQRSPEAARELAHRLKAEIRARCGSCIRCSIGVAPNTTLAKLGTDMMKPDGLVILRDQDIPGSIAHLSVGELSGIGPAMTRRLQRAGIRTIGDLAARSEPAMHALWGGIVGDRWHQILRGREIHEPRIRKQSVGHQHVLAPELRSVDAARGVAVRLLLKAAARMRHDGYAARKLALGLRFAGDAASTSAWSGPSWGQWIPLGEGCADTARLVDALEALWSQAPPRAPLLVSVTLQDLIPPASLTLPLFGAQRRGENLSKAMDVINQRFGANTLYTANMHHARDHGAGGIAFHVVPNLDVADSVQSRQRGGTASTYLTDAQMRRLIDDSLRADRAVRSS